MKKIVFLLCSLTLLADQSNLVVSGFSYHLKSPDVGPSYESVTPGFGYEYISEDRNESDWYNAYSAMIISDSYKHAFPFISYGRGYSLDSIPLSISLDIFAGYKQILINDSSKSDPISFKGSFYAGILPSIHYTIDRFKLNIAYTPEYNFSYHESEVTLPSLFFISLSMRL